MNKSYLREYLSVAERCDALYRKVQDLSSVKHISPINEHSVLGSIDRAGGAGGATLTVANGRDPAPPTFPVKSILRVCSYILLSSGKMGRSLSALHCQLVLIRKTVHV